MQEQKLNKDGNEDISHHLTQAADELRLTLSLTTSQCKGLGHECQCPYTTTIRITAKLNCAEVEKQILGLEWSDGKEQSTGSGSAWSQTPLHLRTWATHIYSSSPPTTCLVPTYIICLTLYLVVYDLDLLSNYSTYL
ncbi:hypothetical protein E2C01_010158 [Portunus trituberculatus]|uniref:Uncharacterized protein n=1 Tax=Portunus trituberculatus TaxID=210409 RepID=A0A5B7D7W4_PORTR|nr:hypothetical protein [Portunus trituberculatus]